MSLFDDYLDTVDDLFEAERIIGWGYAPARRRRSWLEPNMGWLVILGLLLFLFLPMLSAPAVTSVGGKAAGAVAAGAVTPPDLQQLAAAGQWAGGTALGLAFEGLEAIRSRIAARSAQTGTQAPNAPTAGPVEAPKPLSGDIPTEGGSILLQTDPTITAEGIDHVLERMGSPAAGTGAKWIQGSREVAEKLGQPPINPAIALAFFIHESSAATNPDWAGFKGGGAHTYDIGNIICADNGSPYWDGTCFGRFRDYSNAADPWQAGINDWYYLIGKEYIGGRGLKTVKPVLPIYAPWLDNNDPDHYGNTVENMVATWYGGNLDYP